MRRAIQSVVVAFAAVMLLPLVLTVSNSVKSRLEHFGPPTVMVVQFTVDAYVQLLRFPVLRWFGNTMQIIVFSTLLGLVVTVAASMAIARYRFRGRKVVFWAVILSTVIPGQVLFIPGFLMVRAYGLFNSPWGLILPGAFQVALMWFMVRFMEQIPEDLYSMGRIDGLGVLGLLRHVTVPMSAPVIAAFVAQRAVSGWVDFLGPLLILREQSRYTLIVGIQEVVIREMQQRLPGDVNLSIIFAGAVVIMVPAVALFLATQRYFADGMFAKGGK